MVVKETQIKSQMSSDLHISSFFKDVFIKK